MVVSNNGLICAHRAFAFNMFGMNVLSVISCLGRLCFASVNVFAFAVNAFSVRLTP